MLVGSRSVQVSCVRACRLGGLGRAGWYRRSTAKEQSGLRLRIREIALARPRFGYLRIHVALLREGWRVNRERVHRLYRLEGLQVRMRVRRRKRLSLHRGGCANPSTERLRDECLNVNEFESIEQAREKIEAWRVDYNEQRPHGALGHLTPSEYAKSGGKVGFKVIESPA